MPSFPCFDAFRGTDLHNYLKSKTGIDSPDNPESIKAYKDAALELQHEILDNLHNIYSDIGIKGYETKITKGEPNVPKQAEVTQPTQTETTQTGEAATEPTEEKVIPKPETKTEPAQQSKVSGMVGQRVSAVFAGGKISGDVIEDKGGNIKVQGDDGTKYNVKKTDILQKGETPVTHIEQFNSKVDDVANSVKGWFKKLPHADLPEGTQKSGIDFDKLVDNAAGIVKGAYKVGSDIVKAVDDAVQHMKDNWDNAWGKFEDFEDHFRKSFSRINPNVGKEVTKSDAQQLLDNFNQNNPGFVKRAANYVKNSKLANVAVSSFKTFDPFLGSAKSTDSIYNDARLTAITLRKRLGEMQRNNEIAAQGSDELNRFWAGMDDADKVMFIGNLERDVDMKDKKLNDLKKLYRDRMDKVFDVIKSIKDIPYVEDYFPHFWADPEAAKKVFGKIMSHNPLEGNKSFLKQRFYSDIIEGMKNGLQLVTTNPEELTRLAEINAYKFKMANDLFSDLKTNNLAKFFNAGNQPDGWNLVDDPLFKRVVPVTDDKGGVDLIRGGWYMPKDAAEIIKRYSSRGLQGSAIDLIRGYNNMLNQAQLGISFFHGMTTSIDSAVTANAIGIDNISRGKFGTGLWQTAKGITVIPNLFEVLKIGGRVIKDYRSGVINEDVERMIAANARTGFDAVYRTDMLQKFRQAMASHSYGQAVLKAIPALIDFTSKPIFEWFVPRLKVGGFIKLAQNELSKLDNPSQEKIDRTIQKTWDDIENRLGQMTYDNLFWGKTTKDVAFLTTRSVGWNLGTVRAFGGGVGDIPSSVKSLSQGKGLSPRTAWMISLVGQTALMGAATTYLMTGQRPKDWRDYFYPRTGGKDAQGNPERIQYPTYMRDVFNSYYRGVGNEIMSKTSPLLNEGIDIMRNQDFYGREVYDPLDPAYKKGLEILQNEAQQFVPFAWREQPGQHLSPGQSATQKFGITPAPKAIQRGKNLSALYETLDGINTDLHDLKTKRRLKEITTDQYDKRYDYLINLRSQTYQQINSGQ